MLNATARELAIDRAKCLYREWTLIGRTEALHLETKAAKREERERCDFTIKALEDKLYAEQRISDRLRPWATIGKVTVVVGLAAGGYGLYRLVK